MIESILLGAAGGITMSVVLALTVRRRHRFMPRYDTVRIPPTQLAVGRGAPPLALVEAITRVESSYVCDVCIRCGTIVAAGQRP